MTTHIPIECWTEINYLDSLKGPMSIPKGAKFEWIHKDGRSQLYLVTVINKGSDNE